MIIAVDPGGAHCGVATHGAGEVADEVETFTLAPRQFEDWLTEELTAGHVELVIYEGYRLYPWELKSQTWSRVETVEVIGVLLYLCRVHGVAVKEQLPPIKKPTAKVAPKLGWQFARGGDRHSQDAELHLAYHLLRL